MGSTLIGRTLAHYEIVRKLGSGGMGDVYLAHDTVLDRPVAIKILPSPSNQPDDRIRRFVNEAKAASALNHPNIATVHELGSAGGVHFIVMEYVDGETLKARVTRGPLDSADIVSVAIQIAGALDAAHRAGIIHRDVKSSNIVITPRGLAKVLDFGLAKRTMFAPIAMANVINDVTESGAILGTVSYMSPEQALGEQLDHRSDLFSFGIVLYEMATGHLPFRGGSTVALIDQIVHHDPAAISSINPRIPGSLERLIRRCLEKKAENRFQTAAEIADDLRRAETASPEPARRPPLNNVPQQLTRFIGRQREIDEVRRSLSRTRLLTLSGPGGIGKTRLALQAATGLLHDYDDGVWFVEFASLSDPGLVPQTVAATLGVSEERGRSITDTVLDYLKDRRVLLVLDNCEHLIAACAQLADRVLRGSTSVRVLATSREPLGIAGETVFRVPSLEVPDLQGLHDVESVGGYEAAQLFLDRARAVKATFAINTASAAALAKLCVQLDGIPLAIELAASRVRVLSIEQILGRLDDRLSLLTGGSRTALPRQQTLLAAIEWSYNLLSEAERTLFRRLSVFAGGWTLEAAERVCSDDDLERRTVLELLSGLVDKSLVLTEDRDGHPRYRFMVTLLEYAHQRLIETADEGTLQRRHAEFFLAVASEGESKLTGADQKLWLERLNAEYDNLRAALTWTSKHDVTMGTVLAGALGRFWYLRGYLDEGRKWLAGFLSLPGADAHTVHHVKAFNAAARIAQNQGDYGDARSMSEQAMRLASEAGDQRETAAALNTLAILAGVKDEYAAARALLEESLAIRREMGDIGGIAMTLSNLGVGAIRQAQYASAQRFFDEAFDLASQAGDRHTMGTSMVNQGELARRLGNFAAAQSFLDQGLAIAQDLGDRPVISVALSTCGQLAVRQGDYAAARAFVDEALKQSQDAGDKHTIAECLLTLGIVSECVGDAAAARSLFEQSMAIRNDLGEKLEVALGLNCLGRVTARQGDFASARLLHLEALATCQQLGARDGIAQSLAGLADLARLEDDTDEALTLYRRSLSLWWDLGEKPECARPLEYIAAMLAARGQVEEAARLWGAVDNFRTTIAVPRPPIEDVEHAVRLNAGHAAIGTESFLAAWTEGRALDAAAAVACALRDEGESAPPPRS